MLNYAETTTISTNVPIAPGPSTCAFDDTTFVTPMPKQITVGHLTLINDQEEFLQGFDAGMESYAELDYEKQQMTAKELLHDLQETILDQETPLAWRLGFIAGEIAGMLNPDLAVTEGASSFLEGLTRKCQALSWTEVRLCTTVQDLREEKSA